MSETRPVGYPVPSYIIDGTKCIEVGTGEVTDIPLTRPVLYISYPMFAEGNLIHNIRAAVRLADKAYEFGWAPLVPQLNVLHSLINGTTTRQRYMDVDLAYISKADAVCVGPYAVKATDEYGPSGTQQEVDFANIVHCPVYTEDTLPDLRD